MAIALSDVRFRGQSGRQSQRAPGIREQPRPKADKDRSGFLQRKLIIEHHFTSRKSLL